MSLVAILAAAAVILCEATPMRIFKKNPASEESLRMSAVSNARAGLLITLLSAGDCKKALTICHTFSRLGHRHNECGLGVARAVRGGQCLQRGHVRVDSVRAYG